VTLEEDLEIVKDEVETIRMCSKLPARGQVCVISGWGSMDSSGTSASDQLQQLFQPISYRYTCYRNYNGAITNAMVCVGGRKDEGGCKSVSIDVF